MVFELGENTQKDEETETILSEPMNVLLPVLQKTKEENEYNIITIPIDNKYIIPINGMGNEKFNIDRDNFSDVDVRFTLHKPNEYVNGLANVKLQKVYEKIENSDKKRLIINFVIEPLYDDIKPKYMLIVNVQQKPTEYRPILIRSSKQFALIMGNKSKINRKFHSLAYINIVELPNILMLWYITDQYNMTAYTSGINQVIEYTERSSLTSEEKLLLRKSDLISELLEIIPVDYDDDVREIMDLYSELSGKIEQTIKENSDTLRHLTLKNLLKYIIGRW